MFWTCFPQISIGKLPLLQYTINNILYTFDSNDEFCTANLKLLDSVTILFLLLEIITMALLLPCVSLN